MFFSKCIFNLNFHKNIYRRSRWYPQVLTLQDCKIPFMFFFLVLVDIVNKYTIGQSREESRGIGVWMFKRILSDQSYHINLIRSILSDQSYQINLIRSILSYQSYQINCLSPYQLCCEVQCRQGKTKTRGGSASTDPLMPLPLPRWHHSYKTCSDPGGVRGVRGHL